MTDSVTDDTGFALADGHGHGHAGEAWAMRPYLFALVGLIAAVSIERLVPDSGWPKSAADAMSWRVSASAGIATFAFALGYTLERVRTVWSAIFAVVLGLVAAGIFQWSGPPQNGPFDEWNLISLFLGLAIAVPLFQTARDEGAARFPYAVLHSHAWTDAVLWAASWAFVGIVLLLTFLLSALFNLIGIDVIEELTRKEWFMAGLIGGSLGAGLGLLRERDAIVRTLQRVVTTVLGVLAPVLGAGLAIFLIALPFTGLSALWEATKATTPILLTCMIGGLILANAVIGDGDGNGEGDGSRNPVLRAGAAALALTALPLAIIAAIATGLRIGQYGFTPDRLWALVAVTMACVYGVAYLLALLRGRGGWAPYARQANLVLAFLICGIALVLATPLAGFNAISANDQIARLQDGRTKPDKFDWAALAFDFGEPGRAAAKALAASGAPAIRAEAKKALAAKSRWELSEVNLERVEPAEIAKRLDVLPAGTTVPDALLPALGNYAVCGGNEKARCTVVRVSDIEWIVISKQCWENVRGLKDGEVISTGGGAAAVEIPRTNDDCALPRRLVKRGDGWALTGAGIGKGDEADVAAAKAGLEAGKIEVRPVQRRQVFIGGVPVGTPFE